MLEANRRAWAVAAILVALGLVALFLWFRTPEVESDPAGPERARLTAFQLYVSAPIVAAARSSEIAAGVDCFAESGLDIELVRRSKGPEIVDALVGGSADFGTLAVTPVVFQALQGTTLTMFATFMTTDHDIKVIGRRSAGVTSPGSLAGKRVGYVGGTIGEIFLDRYLEKHSLNADDIATTSAGPAQLRDLFLNGSLDAVVIWEPIVQDILADPAASNDDIFLDVDTTLYVSRFTLVAKPETLKARPAAARALVESLLCAERIIAQYPDQARREVESWLERRPDSLAPVFDPSTFRVELDVPSLLDSFETEATWAREAVFSGRETGPIDYSALVDSSVMLSVAPERVIQ